MFDFVVQVWTDFWAANSIEKIGFLLSLTGIGSIVGFIVGLSGRRSARKRLDALHQEMSSLKKERDDARRQADARASDASRWTPSKWIEDAQKEQAQGNEEMAANVLGRGFDLVRQDLSAVCLGLAGYHLSLIVGPNAHVNLSEGERFARLAALLQPEDQEATALLEEAVLAANDPEAIAALPFSAFPVRKDEAAALLPSLIMEVRRHGIGGRFRLGLSLARRAVRIASKAGLSRTPEGIVVRITLAQQLYFMGIFREAQEQMPDLIDDARQVGSERDVILARYLNADILNGLGEHERALKAVRALRGDAPHRISDDGGIVPIGLVLQLLEARILLELERYDEALVQVRDLLPRREKEEGKDSDGVLTSRFIEARILGESGDIAGALPLIAVLAYLYEQRFGPVHPETLFAKALNIEFQSKMVGDIFLSKLSSLIESMPIGQATFAPLLLRMRVARSEIMACGSDKAQALQEIQEIIRILDETVAPTHQLRKRAIKLYETLKSDEKSSQPASQ